MKRPQKVKDQMDGMALKATVFALFTAILWRDSSGAIFSDLPRLEIKGTNFEIGFRIVSHKETAPVKP